MTTTYRPAEGSIAARAIAHLATLPDGTWLTGVQLSAAIDQPSNNLLGGTASAVKHGVLQRRLAGPRTAEYALGKPLDPFDADERRGGKPLQRVVAAQAAAPVGKPGPASVFDVKAPADWRPPPARKPATPARKASAVQAMQPEQPHKPPSVVVAIFNSGELLIEAPGQPPLRLAPGQTRDLLHWLRGLQPAEPELHA